MPVLPNLDRVWTLFIALVAIAGCSLPARKLTAKAPITVVAISDSGELLAAGTSAGRIRIWDRHLDRMVREIVAGDGPLNDLRFAPSGSVLAVANRNLSMYSTHSLDSPKLVKSDGANYGTVRFAEDGRSILTIDGRGQIDVIDVANGLSSFRVCCSTIYGEVAFADDDRKILAAGHWPSVWDRRSGALLARFTAARETMTFGPIAVAADGRSVFMGSQDGRVHRWDLLSARLAGTSIALSDYVTTIAAQGSAPWIAYAARGGPVRLWNTATGETQFVREAHPTSNLCFDASTGLTIFGTQSGEVEFWDLVGGRKLRVIRE